MLTQEIAMNVLEKSLLPEVVGGSVYDSGTSAMADGGGGGGYGGGYDGGSDFNWGFFGDSFASAGGFDGNGVGANSCVPAASASGLFGLTLTETLGASAGLAALAGGIGGGMGASAAIEAAGGFSALGTMGGAASGVGTAMGLGVLAAATTGFVAGTLAYQNSETVRDVSQAVVGGVISVIEGATQGGVLIFGLDREP
jgi:hypothetical protein